MIHRLRTRVIVIAHSHQSDDPIDLSGDVIALSTSKTVKRVGSWQIQLVPRRNWLNVLFPDDVVNLYMDTGTSGFVRLMLGYVDRVERAESVEPETGAVRTIFTVSGSDFMKAIDRTEIYFNPQLAGRTDLSLDERFSATNLGGHALRTRGIVQHGTPADILESLITLLLGFGAQYVLPKSYGVADSDLARRREKRRQRAEARITDDIRKEIAAIGFGDITQIVNIEEFDARVEDLMLKVNRVPERVLRELGSTVAGRRAEISRILTARSSIRAYQAVLRDIASEVPPGMADLLEPAFIETMCVDGYVSSSSIHHYQGTLSSVLYAWTNEIVNELCFDLRPVVEGGETGDPCFGMGLSNRLGYSTEPDELGVNVRGVPGLPPSRAAVKYVPAVVFREYPYSTVEGYDLSRYHPAGFVPVASTETILQSGPPIGFVPFGPVFARGIGETGRWFYDYTGAQGEFSRGISPVGERFESISVPLKHIDVVVLGDDEVVSSSVGRSDGDVFNFMALYHSDPFQQMEKYLLQDFVPIVNPISIARHGLRVREMTSKFTHYTRTALDSKGGGTGIQWGSVPRNLIRWCLLVDHWYQHNVEYLSGTIQCLPRPDIRVGYRLDRTDRRESYYVEGVSHSWRMRGDGMVDASTTIQVSRGQRNDPMPAWIPPSFVPGAGAKVTQENEAFRARVENIKPPELRRPNIPKTVERLSGFVRRGGGNRAEDGRLADFFAVLDTAATQRSRDQELGEEKTGRNEIDVPPNADAGGLAEYPGLPPKLDPGIEGG